MEYIASMREPGIDSTPIRPQTKPTDPETLGPPPPPPPEVILGGQNPWDEGTDPINPDPGSGSGTGTGDNGSNGGGSPQREEPQ